MHIPDGFLSTPVWAALDLAAVPAVAYFARKAQGDLAENRIPLLGVTGAFVFAAQMINFPVGLGTSGHLVGGALLACTLGPAAAAIVMTAILSIQALVFQDGGVLALGANVLNMAVAGVLAGYLPYRLWGGGKWRGASIFLGGALSVLTSAILALAELLLSGVPMRPALLGLSGALFVVSAAVEGAITLAVVRAVERMNPGCLSQPENSWKPGVAFFAGAAVALASVGILIASPAPDGLEKFLADMGLSSKATALFSPPLADYEAVFIRSEWLRKAGAGMAGLVAVLGVCLGVGRVLVRRRNA